MRSSLVALESSGSGSAEILKNYGTQSPAKLFIQPTFSGASLDGWKFL